MSVTVFLHFEQSDKDNNANTSQNDIYACNVYLQAEFQTMPSAGQIVDFDEDDLIALEHQINKNFYLLWRYYPMYIYENDEPYISIYHNTRQEIEDAGLWNGDEWQKGRITASLCNAVQGRISYISDVVEWRKHDDGIFYPHILVKLKDE